jgi:TRAP-type C4-dicarboxylate transport system substrate-binding protein
VRERTQGRINIKLYPGTSLVQGDQTREFSALRQGVIDMAVGSTINWSPQVKSLNLFSLPFLMPDYKAVDAVTQGEVGKKSSRPWKRRRGASGLGRERLPRNLQLQARHQEPADLKGMKIRVVGSPLFLDTFTALGANPTQMSWADAQPAMASGAVDGQENPRVHGRQAAVRGPEAPDHVGLHERPADLRGQQGHLGQLDARRPRHRQAGRHGRRKEEIAIARKGLVEADKPLLKDLAAWA